VCAVKLQFKLLCKRIDRQYKKNMQKLDTTPTTRPTTCYPSVFHRELQKNYNILPHSPMAIITDAVIGGITNGWRTFQCVRLSDCLVGRHNYRWNHQRMWKIQCACALTHSYRRICRRTSKNLERFSKF